jgi:hypothetical protein
MLFHVWPPPPPIQRGIVRRQRRHDACTVTPIMLNVTKIAAQPLETHDTPHRAPTREELVRQLPHDPEALDVVLDNPYDNMACTD